MEKQDVDTLRYSDLLDAKPPIPGAFGLEVYLNGHVKQSVGQWLLSQLDIADIGKFFPGCSHVAGSVQDTGSFQSFIIEDFLGPGAATRLNATKLDYDEEVSVGRMKHGQFKIKKALGAPSVPVAFMGLLLGRMVQKDKMDQATATHILANEMQLGDIAAQGIVQRGIEFLQQQERTP